MRLIPMNLGQRNAAIRQLHMGDALLFSPVADPMSGSQQGEIANAIALGDGFNAVDFPDDYEFHLITRGLFQLRNHAPPTVFT